MQAVTYSLISVILISFISLVGALTIALNEKTVKRWITFFVALAVGALFGDVLLHILPELFEKESIINIPTLVFSGIMIFFILEKILEWRHKHGEFEESKESIVKHDHSKISPIGPLILTADALHNLIDGMIIAAAYLISPSVGIATSIAVILHEIPQEIADFGVLIHAGYTRAKALWFNFVSAFVSVLGAVIVLIAGFSENMEIIVLSIAAGGFIYIAGSDLVPELHNNKEKNRTVVQIIAILIGFAIMFLLTTLE